MVLCIWCTNLCALKVACKHESPGRLESTMEIKIQRQEMCDNSVISPGHESIVFTVGQPRSLLLSLSLHRGGSIGPTEWVIDFLSATRGLSPY